MRVVVDSNRIQSQELADFLSQSPSNRVVVTDWVMMEAYKGETRQSIHKSLGVLARFPMQVVVLKNTGMCMKTRFGAQMANRLIWREHTVNFPEFIRQIQEAHRGDRAIEEEMLSRGAKADERMRQLADGAPAILELQNELRGLLRNEDIDAIRGRKNPAPGILQRIFSVAGAVADLHRLDLGIPTPAIKGKTMASDFLFRVGVAHASRMLEWIRTGCQASTKAERVRNDYVDTMISVFGTYFNGLMSGDAALLRLHDLNRALLTVIGATLPPQYHPPSVVPE